jgi:hypothetical protein
MAAKTISVSNTSQQIVGALGTTFSPGSTKSIELGTLLGRSDHRDELAGHVDAGRLAVSLDGDLLSGNEVRLLDAPKPSELGIIREVFTDVATADQDGIVASFVAPAVETTLSGTDLDGAVGGTVMDPPRNVTIYGAAAGGEALEEKDIVVTGVNADGQTVSETITAAARAATENGTDAGAVAFKQVVSILVPADASGSPGDYEIGFGTVMGLKAPLVKGGLLSEHVDNAVPGTAGTVVLSGTSAPNGTYAPNSAVAPNGSRDYVIVYLPN